MQAGCDIINCPLSPPMHPGQKEKANATTRNIKITMVT